MALPRGVKATYLTEVTGAAPAPMTMDYVASVAWEAYKFGWPLVNAANRAKRAAALTNLTGPVVEGGMPVAFGELVMLRGYMSPGERAIACPNQDTVYGGGIFDLNDEPIVCQIPDFGKRYWVYALYNARTDQFAEIGQQHETKQGFHLVVGPGWNGEIPDGITKVWPSSTDLVFAIPRIFMNDTPDDNEAIQGLIRHVDIYPQSKFTGKPRERDWSTIRELGPCWLPGRRDELQFVKPEAFLRDLRAVMRTVRRLPGEKDLYERINRMLDAAAKDWRIRLALRETFRQAEHEMITPLMKWRLNGVSAGNGWNTSVYSAEWNTHYYYRTATARSNMFESRPHGTRYFYTDHDSNDNLLNGQNSYAITFLKEQLPPVKGFWSLSLYDECHFFHTSSNPLPQRYSLGTKNETTLKLNDDGSLTLYAGGLSPGKYWESNWLPAPKHDAFSLFIRAYWPEEAIETWLPPRIAQI